MVNGKRWRRPNEEKPKANDEIPDGLGLGMYEERDAGGQLYIYLQRQPALYIVIGKYADPGWVNPHFTSGQYYVADYTRNGPFDHVTTKHEHLILALAKVHEIVEDYERRKEK